MSAWARAPAPHYTTSTEYTRIQRREHQTRWKWFVEWATANIRNQAVDESRSLVNAIAIDFIRFPTSFLGLYDFSSTFLCERDKKKVARFAFWHCWCVLELVNIEFARIPRFPFGTQCVCVARVFGHIIFSSAIIEQNDRVCVRWYCVVFCYFLWFLKFTREKFQKE